MNRVRCSIRYAGMSYPQFRGIRCDLEAPHDGLRHSAMVAGFPLSWWTPEEKEAIRARKKARAKEDER